MPTIVTCLLYQTGMLASDYGARGIVLAMVFFLLDGPKVWNKLLVIAGSFVSVFYTQLISCSWMLMQHGMLICPNINRWDLWQLFSLCALPLIFLYSGKKGNVPGAPWLAKALQYGFYIFYPAHLLVIWLLNRI